MISTHLYCDLEETIVKDVLGKGGGGCFWKIACGSYKTSGSCKLFDMIKAEDASWSSRTSGSLGISLVGK